MSFQQLHDPLQVCQQFADGRSMELHIGHNIKHEGMGLKAIDIGGSCWEATSQCHIVAQRQWHWHCKIIAWCVRRCCDTTIVVTKSLSWNLQIAHKFALIFMLFLICIVYGFRFQVSLLCYFSILSSQAF